MALEKETSELIRELHDSASFEQYAESHQNAFTSLSCPYCGAPLRRGASYCVSCMNILNERKLVTLKKMPRKRGRKLLLSGGILLAGILIVLGIVFLRPGSNTYTLPDPVEYQALLVGSLDENTRLLWDPSGLSPAGSSNSLQFFETTTPLSGSPVRIAFSEDRKRLYFALTGFPSYASGTAENILENAFSALFRRKTENLSEIFRSDDLFTQLSAPDDALQVYLNASLTEIPEDASIFRSLPVRPERNVQAPAATIYRIRSDGSVSYVVLFDTEAL